jgi:hypothetical protein
MSRQGGINWLLRANPFVSSDGVRDDPPQWTTLHDRYRVQASEDVWWQPCRQLRVRRHGLAVQARWRTPNVSPTRCPLVVNH